LKAKSADFDQDSSLVWCI